MNDANNRHAVRIADKGLPTFAIVTIDGMTVRGLLSYEVTRDEGAFLPVVTLRFLARLVNDDPNPRPGEL